MTDHTPLIDRYIAAWNETDTTRRRDLIARTYTESACYIDPVVKGDGHRGIDAMIAAVQERFPGHAFRRTSDVEAHNDRVRFRWELAPAKGPPVVAGTDFGVLAENGARIAAVTGFFDHVAAQASGS